MDLSIKKQTNSDVAEDCLRLPANFLFVLSNSATSQILLLSEFLCSGAKNIFTIHSPVDLNAVIVMVSGSMLLRL